MKECAIRYIWRSDPLPMTLEQAVAYALEESAADVTDDQRHLLHPLSNPLPLTREASK